MTPDIIIYHGDDAAADWRPVVMEDDHAPSYDEWAVMRLMAGKTPGTFAEYLSEIAPDLTRVDVELER
jgi:hypothetical protein